MLKRGILAFAGLFVCCGVIGWAQDERSATIVEIDRREIVSRQDETLDLLNAFNLAERDTAVRRVETRSTPAILFVLKGVALVLVVVLALLLGLTWLAGLPCKRTPGRFAWPRLPRVG
jgi:hypothetical protein